MNQRKNKHSALKNKNISSLRTGKTDISNLSRFAHAKITRRLLSILSGLFIQTTLLSITSRLFHKIIKLLMKNTQCQRQISRNLVTSGNGLLNGLKPARYPGYTEQQQRLSSFHTSKWAIDSKPDPVLFAEWGVFCKQV